MFPDCTGGFPGSWEAAEVVPEQRECEAVTDVRPVIRVFVYVQK